MRLVDAFYVTNGPQTNDLAIFASMNPPIHQAHADRMRRRDAPQISEPRARGKARTCTPVQAEAPLPPAYLLTYLHVLTHSHRHACFLACLLTSDPSQGSRGHVNPKGPKAVISTFVQRGYEHDRNATRMLRKCAKHPNFRNCILVFRHR